MGSLLQKIRGKNQAYEHQVGASLGIVGTLGKQLSANQMAAKGIKLTIRDQLGLMQSKSIEKHVSEAPLESVIPAESLQKQPSRYDDDDEDEEGGIEFVDPSVEMKLKAEQKLLEKKKEVQMIRLADGTMVPSTTVTGSMPGSTVEKPGQARYDFLRNLK